ncbi:MAG: tetratricopeptide repeat protein [Pirellulaceae bacterium]
MRRATLEEREPHLLLLYQEYLSSENTARFVSRVAHRYTLSTLERLAWGRRTTRRAAVLALGYLGDYNVNAVLGRALHDKDRGVRLLAENVIRDVWQRDGSRNHQHDLGRIVRWNQCGRLLEAVDLSSKILEVNPHFAEVWNQRAIAYFQLEDFEQSAEDCHMALELNPYHFGAAVGMGHCYLEINDAYAALECFRRALKINPALEGVRAQVGYLERTLDGR